MTVAVVAGGRFGIKDIVAHLRARVCGAVGVIAPLDTGGVLDESALRRALAVVHAVARAHAGEVEVIHGGTVGGVENARGGEQILTAAAVDRTYTLSHRAVRARAHEIGVGGGRRAGRVLAGVGRGVIDPVAVHRKTAGSIGVVYAEGHDHLSGVVVDRTVLVELGAHDALLVSGAPFVGGHAAHITVDEVDVLALFDIVTAVGHDGSG